MSDPQEQPTHSSPLPAEERARADLYGVLAWLLSAAPGQAGLNQLEELDSGDGVMAPAWDALRDAADGSDAAAVDDEYHALFIGLGRGELSPYASWYLTGLLMEKPLAELRRDLRRLGYARQDGVNEPEDHVAALCEVMRMIIFENVLSYEDQKAFFDAHIEPWMPRFFSDLEQAECAHFYRAVGKLGKDFLDLESAYFDMPA